MVLAQELSLLLLSISTMSEREGKIDYSPQPTLKNVFKEEGNILFPKETYLNSIHALFHYVTQETSN